MPSAQYLPILIILVLVLAGASFPAAGAAGVYWGTAASQPLPAGKVVELLRSNSLGKVRLSDADPLVLEALSGSKVGVTVGIPNAMLPRLNASAKSADAWVHDNVTRYLSSSHTGVRIEYVFSFCVFCFGSFLLCGFVLGWVHVACYF